MRWLKFFSIVLTILFVTSFTNTQAEINKSQNVVTGSILSHPSQKIYGNSFWVQISYFEDKTADITFKTSYMKFNETRMFKSSTFEIFWIDVPSTQKGSDRLEVFDDERFLTSFSFEWEKLDSLGELIFITYSNSWFSSSYGNSMLIAKYSDDNTFTINYDINITKSGYQRVKPYDTDYLVSGKYNFDKLLTNYNESNLPIYQTWDRSIDGIVCEGSGYSQQITLGFEQREVIYNYSFDTCSGETSFVSPDARIFIQTLNSTTYDLMRESNTELSILNNHFDTLSFIILIMLRKLKRLN